jgi:hypothetical protein
VCQKVFRHPDDQNAGLNLQFPFEPCFVKLNLVRRRFARMLATAPYAGLPPSHFHTASAALEHLESRYLPEWEALYLREGDDSTYPLPSAHGTRDLLEALRGVRGLAVPCRGSHSAHVFPALRAQCTLDGAA